ncbi:MAG: hypothetical protein U0359_01680 [Byssovorax sp.]
MLPLEPAMSLQCSECKNVFDMPAVRCPHCGEPPGVFPNVWAAQQQENVDELDRRFQDALADAKARGCEAIALAFLAKVADSKAVIARQIHDIERLSYSDRELYATYHQQLNAQIRLPYGDEWDEFRRSADEALFPGYKEEIRFAALSLGDIGVSNYGDWSMMLRTPLIQKRASAFVENSLVFVRDRKVPIAEAKRAFIGYRACWADRAKLSVAKLVRKMTAATTVADLPGLLLEQAPPGKSADDRFVEVHIFGPLTIRTVEKVTLVKARDSRRLAKASRLRAIEKSLAKMNVTLGVQP